MRSPHGNKGVTEIKRRLIGYLQWMMHELNSADSIPNLSCHNHCGEALVWGASEDRVLGVDSGLADRGVRLELRRIPPSSPCPGSRLGGRVPSGALFGKAVLLRSLGAEGAGWGWPGVV